VETTAYYAFGVPLFAALMAWEWRRARRRGAPTARFSEGYGNLTAGFGTIVIGLFLGPALVGLYEWALAHFSLVTWAPGAVAPWVLAIVLADLGHYLHHRLDHRVAACWAVHGVHHMPEHMDFTVAMRHAWFSDLYSFPFYIPLPLLGVPSSHFFAATTLLSLHALITHTEQFDFPSLGVLVTPGAHVLHHARNARYLDRNFGAMLCVWDRLFGTYVTRDPSDPPVYGTSRGYATHDGARAQWVLWADLFALVRQARTPRGRLAVLLGRPDTTPPGLTLAPVSPPPADALNSPRRKVYVALQLLAAMGASLYVCTHRDSLPRPLWVITLVGMLATIATLGGLVDRRPGASRWEIGRLVASLVALVVAWRLR
jgi:sterol desaturase/sphingolipid hydroxylase (fatty acid hydroxylase superfamily)